MRRAAARGLREAGPEASDSLGALQEALSDPDSEVVRQCAVTLGSIGAAAEPAVPSLVELLKHDELAVRFSAAIAIHRIDPGEDAIHPVLIQAMQTGDGGAILAVAEMGPAAVWAVPTLEKLARHRDPNVRLLAVTALGRIGPNASEAEDVLEAAMDDRHAGVREAASRSLQSVRSSVP